VFIKDLPFDVKNKTIHIHFESSECYQKYKGVCPIVHETKFTPSSSDHLFRNDERYCPALLYKIRENGFNAESSLDQIRITYFSKSNHYVVREGRHRVCIAIKSDLKIKAVVENVDIECDCCPVNSK